MIPLTPQNKTTTSRHLLSESDHLSSPFNPEIYPSPNDSVIDSVSATLAENLDSIIFSQRVLSAFSFFSAETSHLRHRRRLSNKPSNTSLQLESGSSTSSEDNHSRNASAISITIKQTAKSRILPGEIFKEVANNGAEMERYRVGSSGLELLLTVSPSKNKNGSPLPDSHVGGFGYDSLPANFKMFQQSHGASRSYQQSSKCNFAVKTQSSDVELTTHHKKALNNSHEDAVIFDELDSSLILRDHHPAIRSFQSQVFIFSRTCHSFR